MQAWQQVQVSNKDSGYFGAAGYVVRSETKGDATIVTVKLDGQDETVTMDATELRVL